MKVPPVEKPGTVVAINQLILQVPGLISQMKGFITRKHYIMMTMFVDHFSGLSFVHNQMSTDVEHMIEAKRAFEQCARNHGVACQ